MSHPLQTNPPNLSTNPTQPPGLNPIIDIFLFFLKLVIDILHDQELRKTALKLALLIALAIFFQESAIELGLGSHLIKILLSTGWVAIWNGIMLRKTYPRAASLVEQAGIDLVFLAFNMLLASVVPKGIVWWLPVLCFGFFILPLVMAVLPPVAALLRSIRW